jgi:hypothetical protein
MRPMAINLGIIIVARIIIKNTMDVLMPFVKYWYRFYEKTNGTFDTGQISPPEMDFMLMEYNPIIESVRRYADVAVQYGYTVLFAPALPIAPLLSLVYNYVKVKTQIWKLLSVSN